MKNIFVFFAALALSMTACSTKESSCTYKDLPVAWEELTSYDFVEAVKKSGGVAVIPMAVVEKHGQHLPVGTDIFVGREIALRAAEMEYCIVFPYHLVAQNFVAMAYPGTVAHTADIMYRWLDETCRELARNGIKKIIFLNSHGGNAWSIPFFLQQQLESPRDYVVYFSSASPDSAANARIRALTRATSDGHGGENETSLIMAIRPDLVKMEHAADEKFTAESLLPSVVSNWTGIRWFQRYPNHIAGDPRTATKELGEAIIQGRVEGLARVIREVKNDQTTLKLQQEFFRRSQAPLEAVRR